MTDTCAECGKPIHKAEEGPWVHDQPYNPWTPPLHAPKPKASWECACGEMTTVSHWRHGADGAMFHAGPDAPPSDPAPNNESEWAGEGR